MEQISIIKFKYWAGPSIKFHFKRICEQKIKSQDGADQGRRRSKTNENAGGAKVEAKNSK